MVIRGPKCKALKFLSRSELEDIHSATLEVLEKTGMHSESDKILKIFDESGADVSFDDRRIRIPENLINDALKKTPNQYILHGRNAKYDILCEDGRVYFGMGGTPVPFIRDLETEEFREPIKKDMEQATRLGDYLSNMSYIMSLAGSYDMPYEAQYIHDFDALFNNTEKPIIYAAPGSLNTEIVLEMASTIVGGREKLRKRPILSIYCETSSPLSFSRENENIIECAENGIPITLGPGPLLGGTAPITLSGASVVSNAENLAAITLAQLMNKGTPINYAAWSVTLDPRTGVACYSTPENALTFGVINGQLADYYDLPSFGLGGPVDSKTPDAQAGSEMTLIALASALSGVTLIHDAGYLASGNAGCLEMAVICNEVFGMILRVVRGVTVDEESLAVDVIEKVGPRKHFFSQKHTLKLLEREIYIPTLFDKRPLDTWIRDGSKPISKIAKGKVEEILREHQPKPLEEDVKQRLSEIVKEAEKRLTKTG